MNYSYKKVVSIVVSLVVLISCNKNFSRVTKFEDHDTYYRKNFCNNEYRREITNLPPHLLDVCLKSNVNPKDIHVYRENSYQPYAAHTYGTNISLTNSFEKLSIEQQAWYFAHELSHVKHKDTGPDIYRQRQLVDLKIISTAITTGWLGINLILNRSRISHYIKPVFLLSLVNVAASFMHYKKAQNIELRANEEASTVTSVDTGISVIKEYVWLRDHSADPSIKSRLKTYLTWLGFSNHPSLEKELAHLETQAKKANPVTLK